MKILRDFSVVISLLNHGLSTFSMPIKGLKFTQESAKRAFVRWIGTTMVTWTSFTAATIGRSILPGKYGHSLPAVSDLALILMPWIGMVTGIPIYLLPLPICFYISLNGACPKCVYRGIHLKG